MPSGHSATVSAVMISAGLYKGWDSATFAVAAILAIIVMHDAMNVRLESGKQAHLLNVMAEMFEELTGTDLPNDKRLKELLGHTPLQVGCGCALGIVVAIAVYFLFQ
jgi:acid phosphatase family membrane protein YuiD